MKLQILNCTLCTRFIILLALAFTYTVSFGQQPGAIDASFNSGSGTSDVIASTVLQADGKIIIGGFFDTYNNVPASKIARLNADGSRDASFVVGSGFDEVVSTVLLQPDGKIIVCGAFTSYRGLPVNSIARLNPDGSLDTSFNPGNGVDGYLVYTAALQPDGKLIIGGDFQTWNSTPCNGIARLNADGSFDTSFNVGSGIGVNNSDIPLVYTLALQPDGKMLLAGRFNTYNGITRNGIARLQINGTLDQSFNAGTGPADDGLYTLAVQQDSKILVGGYFNTFNSVPANSIIRLNSDGTVDNSFITGSGVGAGNDYSVFTITLQPDAKIFIGGTFEQYNGVSRSGLARLNTNGSLDTSFDHGAMPSPYVISSFLQPDGKIVIAGDILQINGASHRSIARLHAGPVTAVKGELQNDITMYPNPTTGKVYIPMLHDGSYELQSIEVYSLTGQLVKCLNVPDISNTTMLDLSALSNGSYIVRLITNQQIINYQLQLQH